MIFLRLTFSFVFCTLLIATAHGQSSVGSTSPTSAYMKLYAAVKMGKTDGIKATMSAKTIEFCLMVSERNGTPLEKVFQNGLTATTFSQHLPTTRDERIKFNMGAVEVWNAKDGKWEDLPFIFEEGSWKLAVGELFAGTYKSPDSSRSRLAAEKASREREKRHPLPKTVVKPMIVVLDNQK